MITVKAATASSHFVAVTYNRAGDHDASLTRLPSAPGCQPSRKGTAKGDQRMPSGAGELAPQEDRQLNITIDSRLSC